MMHRRASSRIPGYAIVIASELAGSGIILRAALNGARSLRSLIIVPAGARYSDYGV